VELVRDLQQGLLTYMKAKQLNRENQIQNLTAGVETDEQGNLKVYSRRASQTPGSSSTDP
jgi:uncharacterized protein YqeY